MPIPKGYRIKEGFGYVLEPDGSVPEEVLRREREEQQREAGQACFGSPIPDPPSRCDPNVTDEELQQALLRHCKVSHDMVVEMHGGSEEKADEASRQAIENYRNRNNKPA